MQLEVIMSDYRMDIKGSIGLNEYSNIYDYLDGKPDGVRAYNGEYMAQYSWGEIKNVILRDKSSR